MKLTDESGKHPMLTPSHVSIDFIGPYVPPRPDSRR